MIPKIPHTSASIRGIILACALLPLGILSSAHATLIAYDGFTGYTSGENVSGNSGGTGWDTNWASALPTAVTAVTPGTAMSYTSGSISIDGGDRVAEINGTAASTDNLVSRSFAAQTGTLYFSFLFRTQARSTSDSTDDFLQFMLNDDTVTTASGSIGDLNTATSNAFSARVGGTNGGSNVASTAPAMAVGTTYFAVGKLSKVSASSTYNQMELFFNPTTFTEPGTANATSVATGGPGSVSFFSLRSNGIDAGDAYWFDELRIGTTWADVIPEPSFYALLLGAGGFLIFLRGPRKRW